MMGRHVASGPAVRYNNGMNAENESRVSNDRTISCRGLYWNGPALDPESVSTFARESGLDDTLSALLLSRGVSSADVDGFLNPSLKALFPDPSSFADMDKAASLIIDGLLSGKRIAVFADYDVDGATSAAQLIKYFRHFGQELVLYVPDRIKEGYGPSADAFQHLKDEGLDLVITVDCGAAALDALAHADRIDLPVVVLDHHLMHGAIPACAALVNPNRPDCTSGQGHLAAAGVVFVLLAALNRELRKRGKAPSELPDLFSFLDLCALGTLCDMAPLKGVNRAFVVQGLKILQRDESVGLLALSQVSGRSAPRSVTDLTFGIGPQMNAGGRIGDPWLATRLLASERMEEALGIAEQLFSLNEIRKQVEHDILQQARHQIENTLSEAPDTQILVASGEGWHPGVIGITAGRLKDEFHRPVIVIGWGEEFGELAKGSGRSVPGINLGSAISKAAEAGILAAGGGHAMAGGLSVERNRIDELRGYLNQNPELFTEELAQAREVQIDVDVFGSALDMNLIEIIEKAGPYGAESPKPLIRIRNVRVEFSKIIGKNHKKVLLHDGTGKVDAVAWRVDGRPLGDVLVKDNVIDVLGYVERNTWQGRSSVQFEIFDAIHIK